MNRPQFNEVMKLARNMTDSLSIDISALMGCGLPDFKPVTVSKECAAAHLRWQALLFNNQWDSTELNETWQIFRRRVQIV
jgi:hypothetical protein